MDTARKAERQSVSRGIYTDSVIMLDGGEREDAEAKGEHARRKVGKAMTCTQQADKGCNSLRCRRDTKGGDRTQLPQEPSARRETEGRKEHAHSSDQHTLLSVM